MSTIPKSKVLEVLSKHGIAKPTDGMVRELQDFMSTHTFVNDKNINDIIGKHARRIIHTQQRSNQHVGAVSSATQIPNQAEPTNTEMPMKDKDLKSFHLNMISNAILLKNNGNLPEAMRILGQIPDNSPVVKERNKEIEKIEKAFDQKLKEDEKDQKIENLPDEHNAIIDIAIKLRNAGDYEGALEKLKEVPNNSPVKNRRDDNIDQIKIEMKAIEDDDVNPS